MCSTWTSCRAEASSRARSASARHSASSPRSPAINAESYLAGASREPAVHPEGHGVVAQEQRRGAGQQQQAGQFGRAGRVGVVRQRECGAELLRRPAIAVGEVSVRTAHEAAEEPGECGLLLGEPFGGRGDRGHLSALPPVGGRDAGEAQHVQRADRVAGRQLQRGSHEQVTRVGGYADAHFDQAMPPVDLGALGRAGGLRPGMLDQLQGPGEPPREPGGVDGVAEQPNALLRIRGQLRRALERQRRGDESAAPVRTRCRLFEIVRGGGVRFDARRGPMPRPPVGVRLGVQHLGERRVGSAATGVRRRLVHRRADERMPELDLRLPHVYQVRLLGGVQGVSLGAEARRGSQDRRRGPGVVGGSDEENRPGRRRQSFDARPIGPDDAPADGKWCQARELRLVERRGQLEQGERVPAGFVDEPLARIRGHGSTDAVVEQRPRRIGSESAQAQHGQTGRPEAARLLLPGREHHGQALRLDPAGGEHQRLGRRVVQPVRVVDDAQDRLLLRGLGQQAQHGERHEEPLLVAALFQAERAPQCPGLRLAEPVDQRQDRAQQLVQTGVGKSRLGLDPGRVENRHAGGLPAGVVQQRRLADPRLTQEEQHAALPAARVRDQRVDDGPLAVASVEHVTLADPVT